MQNALADLRRNPLRACSSGHTFALRLRVQENNPHWMLDVIFDEDRRRTRKDNSALKFAIS